MYAIREVQLSELRAAIEPLLPLHVDELTTDKALMVLAPDWSRYEVLECSGAMFSLVVEVGGEVCGYSVNIVGPHLHYASLRIATNDVLFLHPAHRTSRAGLALIKRTEGRARELGAQMMAWHAKPDTPLERILRLRRDTRVQDIVFSTRL